MGLIKRFSDAHRVKGAHGADRVDDPGAAFDMAHERQLRALQQLRTSSAQLVASTKRLEVQALNLRTRRSRLDEQARRSLAAGREDEAVDALTHALELDLQVEDLDARVAQLGELHERLEVNGRRLQARVLTARTQAETMRAQYGAAQATVSAGEAIAGLGPEDSDLDSLVRQAHDKILWTQARAEALSELLASGTIRRVGESGPDEMGQIVASASTPAKVQQRMSELRADLEADLEGDLEAEQQLPPA